MRGWGGGGGGGGGGGKPLRKISNLTPPEIVSGAILGWNLQPNLASVPQWSQCHQVLLGEVWLSHDSTWLLATSTAAEVSGQTWQFYYYWHCGRVGILNVRQVLCPASPAVDTPLLVGYTRVTRSSVKVYTTIALHCQTGYFYWTGMRQSLPPLTDELKSQTIRHRALCLSNSSPLFNHALHGVGLWTVIFKQAS